MKPLFITLNEFTYTEVGEKRINANSIAKMERTNIRVGHAGTLIEFIGGQTIKVMESPTEIEQLIKQTNNEA